MRPWSFSQPYPIRFVAQHHVLSPPSPACRRADIGLAVAPCIAVDMHLQRLVRSVAPYVAIRHLLVRRTGDAPTAATGQSVFEAIQVRSPARGLAAKAGGRNCRQ